MCGIFTLLNNSKFDVDIIHREFMKGQKRGPEFSKLETSYTNTVLGFHRLAINGLNNESNQPLAINDVVLICNGEIYNYKKLYNYILSYMITVLQRIVKNYMSHVTSMELDLYILLKL